MASQNLWTLSDHLIEQGKIVLVAPQFDVDSFPSLGEQLVGILSATIIEKQLDADLHSWLIDFEGCRFFLRAEHYSESVWLEAVVIRESREELTYLANLFAAGIACN